jgi:hypothetical protein
MTVLRGGEWISELVDARPRTVMPLPDCSMRDR